LSPVFVSQLNKRGACGRCIADITSIQAERKVKPSTHEPDLDNANVGYLRHKYFNGSYPDRATSVFCYLRKDVNRMVKVNGTELDIAGKTVEQYLETTDYDRKRIAVERNGDIVPKAKYAETVLYDGDSIEIVSFVGGG